MGNIIRRTLFITREEYHNIKKGSVTTPSLYMLGSNLKEDEDYDQPIDQPSSFFYKFLLFINLGELKDAILGSLNELIEELQNIYRNIADQGKEHIHAK